MTSQEWLAYFEQNRRDRFPVAWDEPVQLDATVRAPVLWSLARFQLGESSDGRWLRGAARRLTRRSHDAAYEAAVHLFINEEQEHARLLARTLERFGVPLLRHHWSEWLFRQGRHALGFYQEIAMLLMAEIIALKYYTVVLNGTDDAALRRVCDQILHDEKFHVRFHCETLHRLIQRRPLVLQRATWWGLTLMFAGAATVVAWDHREAFAALGAADDEFLEDAWKTFAAARQAIFTGETFVWNRALGRVAGPLQPVPIRPKWQIAWNLCRRSLRTLWSASHHWPRLAH